MTGRQLVIVLVLVGLLVAGVALLLLPEDEAATPGAATAAQPGEPDALPNFSAEIDRQAPAERIEVPVTPDATGREHERAERRSAGPRRTVSGVVVRAADATPLSGVVVAALSREQADALAATLAGRAAEDDEDDESERPVKSLVRLTIEDEDGRFELGVPVDAVALSVTRSDPWPKHVQMYDLAPGAEDVSDLRLVFDSGFTLTGVVLDEGGSRLGGGKVEVNGVVEAQSDAIGEFVFHDLAPAPGVASVRVTARAPGHARGTADARVPQSSAEVVQVELRLPLGGAIAGRLTDAKGEPLADAQACVVFTQSSEHGGMAPGGLSATSDAHGDYLIDSVPADRYIVEIGYGAGLTLQGGTFAGSFELDPGRPLAGQIVSKLSESHGLALRWFSGVDVQVGRTTRLDATLYPPGSVAGRVVDDRGAPVTDAKLTLERIERWPAKDFDGSMVTSMRGLVIKSSGTDGKGSTELAQLERECGSDEKGEYRFDKLMDGAKRLTVTAAGLVPQSLELRLEPAQALGHVDFVLTAGLSVSGRVRDPQGAPIDGADVEVKAIDEQTFTGGEIQTDASGRFELTGLPPGPKQLLVFKSGYASVFQHVEPGQADDLEITLKLAPKVIGIVTNVAGDPITNFDVSISYEGSSWTNSGGNYPGGRFELPIDSDTPCTVTVRSPGFEQVVMKDILPSRTALDPLQIRLYPE